MKNQSGSTPEQQDSFKRGSLAGNMMSNSATRIVRAIFQIFFTPLFIILLGAEQYGLVAFSMTVQMLFFIFDQAISPTIIRAFSAAENAKNKNHQTWKIFYTFERVSFFIGIVFAILIVLCAPYIAEHWLQEKNLPQEVLTNSVRLIGLTLAAQWPSLFYTGCFIGLHRQKIPALISITMNSLHTFIALGILYFLTRDVQIFIFSQGVSAGIISYLMRRKIIQILPQDKPVKTFDFIFLRNGFVFTSGTFLIGITTAIIAQADKIFISRTITLDEFAAYALAFNLCAYVISVVSAPVSATLLAHFSSGTTAQKSNPDFLRDEYRTWSQMNAILIVPLAMVLMFFSEPLLKIWLGSGSELIPHMLKILPLVIGGYLLGGLNTIPYTLHIAMGKTRTFLWVNFVCIVIMMIILMLYVPHYTIYAGASAWLMVNVIYILIYVPLMHKDILRGELWRFWGQGCLFPVTVCGSIFYLFSTLSQNTQSLLITLFLCALAYGISMVCLTGSLPYARRKIISRLSNVLRPMPLK